MPQDKPEVSLSRTVLEQLKRLESKLEPVIREIHIEDEKWRESQVEEPERWDGMS